MKEIAKYEREEFLKVIEKQRAAEEKEKLENEARLVFFRQN
jgi:hypothetical protein